MLRRPKHPLQGPQEPSPARTECQAGAGPKAGATPLCSGFPAPKGQDPIRSGNMVLRGPESSANERGLPAHALWLSGVAPWPEPGGRQRSMSVCLSTRENHRGLLGSIAPGGAPTWQGHAGSGTRGPQLSLQPGGQRGSRLPHGCAGVGSCTTGGAGLPSQERYPLPTDRRPGARQRILHIPWQLKGLVGNSHCFILQKVHASRPLGSGSRFQLWPWGTAQAPLPPL